MNERRVDARGLACPQPVLLTRQAIQESGAEVVRVVVDDEVACENVQRMGRSQGYEACVERRGGEVEVVLTRGGGGTDPALEAEALACGVAPEGAGVVALVASDLFGAGDEELGRVLMRSFVKTLGEVEPRPAALIFLNSGVRLTTEGSDLIDDIRALEEGGMEVLSCGTCLDYYRLADALRVGRATNMFEIASRLLGAGRVVRV
jgi:selenium metabolism protein YedF